MATAGTGKLTRRSADQRGSAATPTDVGASLRDARERLGVSLGEVRDRTGIPWQYLEALEAMDLAGLPDQRTVVTAARRYSEVVGLDPSEVCGTALRVWQDVHWTQALHTTSSPPTTHEVLATTGRGKRRQGVGSPNGSSGSRRPGPSKRDPAASTSGESSQAALGSSDSSGRGGLETLTRTAEVPGITKGAGLSIHFADTGPIPAASRFHGGVRPAPRWLRMSVAVAAALLLIAGAGMVVHHYKPQWFKDLHLTRENASGPPAAAASIHGGTSGRTTPSSGSGRSSNAAVVTQRSSSTDSASITVRSANYQVVVLAQQPCWVDATVPSSSTPVFENVLQAGQKQVLTPSGGQMSVQLGASGVVVGVQVGGKTVPGWLFVPSNAPFTLSFSSAPGS